MANNDRYIIEDGVKKLKNPPRLDANGVPMSYSLDEDPAEFLNGNGGVDDGAQPPANPFEDEEGDPKPKKRPSSKATTNNPPNPPAQAPHYSVPLPIPEPDKAPVVEPKVFEKPRQISTSNIVNAFKQEMGSCLTPITIFSTGEEYLFKEITVTEQKTLAKVSVENQNRRDIIYSTQCALLNKLADDKNFNVYHYTEFDRIVMLMTLYQNNYFKNDITFTCPECGKENVYRLDFSKIMNKIKNSYRAPVDYEIAQSNRKLVFNIGWPNVNCVNEFLREYYKKYNGANDKGKETIDTLSNLEYLVMFIKKITLIPANRPDSPIMADLEDLSYKERCQIVDSLPQGSVFDEDEGVIGHVSDDFVEPLNKCFQYEPCAWCGAQTNEGMGSLSDFF